MTITNLSRFNIIDRKTGKSIMIPRGYFLDYASDGCRNEVGIYSLAGRGKYRVVLADIEIVRK